MLSFFINYTEQYLVSKDAVNKLDDLTTDVSNGMGLSNDLQTEQSVEDMEDINKRKLYDGFKLPITYLDTDSVFPVSSALSNDLELLQSPNKPMYEYLFQPKHTFARDMMSEWNKQYTNDVQYLNETIQVIQNMSEYKNKMDSHPHAVDCDKFIELWTDLKEDDDFLGRYGYIEWDFLKHFNESTSFLQTMSLLQVVAPIINLILPFFLLVMPFVIIQIQGIEMSFANYLTILKQIGSNHIIGKALGIESFSLEKLVYLAISFLIYFYQIYQNIVQCQRFYRNIEKVNRHLFFLKEYCDYSIASMEAFVEPNHSFSRYQSFHTIVQSHRKTMSEIREILIHLKPFTPSVSTFSEMGSLLKTYYLIYSRESFENTLRFSVGFEGYVNNLLGVYENITSGNISRGTFDNSGCVLKEQYYPVLIGENPVKNHCSFNNTNMILTGVNASGKTTILKTTTINILFTQQVGYGFYQSCSMTPYTHIHSYLNIPDTSGRDSLFQAESRRCKEIIDTIHKYNDCTKYRHFCIFDELYSGTNPYDATKSAYAFLLYLTKFKGVNFILTTHYIGLCKKLKTSNFITCYKMSTKRSEDGKLSYTYKMKKGISKEQGAIQVLQQLQYPDEIIQTIRNYTGV